MNVQNRSGGVVDGATELRSLRRPIIQTLGGTLTLTAAYPNLLSLDPGGAARTVLLPAESVGLWFEIINTADANEPLTVNEDSNTTTIGIVRQNETMFFWCDGTNWYGRVVGSSVPAVPRAVVPTSDGLTTGLLYFTDRFVEATSANAAHWLTLPLATAATRGKELWIWVVPSTNCELRTPASADQTINNVACGSSANEALLTHTQLYICRQHLATGWLLQAFTALGAVATAIVPDA